MRLSILLYLFLSSELTFCGIAFATQAAKGELCIELLDTNTGAVVHAVPVFPGDGFTLKYIHSVEKTPVFERYVINASGDIYLQETIIKSSGYGLPETQSTGNFRFENGWLRITDFNLKISPLVFRVSYLNDMLLIFDEHIVNLPDIAPHGNRIEVRIQPIGTAKEKNRSQCYTVGDK